MLCGQSTHVPAFKKLLSNGSMGLLESQQPAGKMYSSHFQPEQAQWPPTICCILVVWYSTEFILCDHEHVIESFHFQLKVCENLA